MDWPVLILVTFSVMEPCFVSQIIIFNPDLFRPPPTCSDLLRAVLTRDLPALIHIQRAIHISKTEHSPIGAAWRDTTQSWMLLTEFPIDFDCLHCFHTLPWGRVQIDWVQPSRLHRIYIDHKTLWAYPVGKRYPIGAMTRVWDHQQQYIYISFLWSLSSSVSS